MKSTNWTYGEITCIVWAVKKIGNGLKKVSKSYFYEDDLKVMIEELERGLPITNKLWKNTLSDLQTGKLKNRTKEELIFKIKEVFDLFNYKVPTTEMYAEITSKLLSLENARIFNKRNIVSSCVNCRHISISYRTARVFKCNQGNFVLKKQKEKMAKLYIIPEKCPLKKRSNLFKKDVFKRFLEQSISEQKSEFDFPELYKKTKNTTEKI